MTTSPYKSYRIWKVKLKLYLKNIYFAPGPGSTAMHFSIFRLFAIVILKIFIPTFFVTSQLERLNQTGIGATFPLDIYQSWMSYYGSSRFGYVDIRQKYNARGSEAGLTAMVQTLSYGTPNQSPFLVESLLPDFGTSELPYTDKEALNYTDLVTFPVLAG